MNLTNYDQVMKIINSPEFQAEKERLVKYYNVTASAKYTLEPRDDFITHIINEFLKIAYQASEEA